MKRILWVSLGLFLIIGFTNCSKGDSGGGGTPPPTEQNLLIAISPDLGTSIVAALSSSYAFKLLINSTPPNAGVKIDLTTLKESDNSLQFSQSVQTSNNSIKSVDLILQNLVVGTLYLIKLDVTSLTTPSNKASVTFKIARK